MVGGVSLKEREKKDVTPTQSRPTPLFQYISALFCTHETVNPIILNGFRTLFTKSPGVPGLHAQAPHKKRRGGYPKERKSYGATPSSPRV